MGVQVREKEKGSGVYWIFINHHGKRRAKKDGKKTTANKIAEQVSAKLILGEYIFEKIEKQLKLFFDKLYRGGLTVGTIKGIRAPIAGIMAHALESELIEANPILGLAMNYKSQKKRWNR